MTEAYRVATMYWGESWLVQAYRRKWVRLYTHEHNSHELEYLDDYELNVR